MSALQRAFLPRPQDGVSSGGIKYPSGCGTHACDLPSFFRKGPAKETP